MHLPTSPALFSGPGLTRVFGGHWTYGLAFFGLIVLLLGAASGCSTTGNLGRGEKLYTGADLHIEHEGEIPDEGDLRDQLETLIAPRPNSKLLGLFRMKLWLYNAGLFKETMGEPPVLLRTVEPDRVAARMRTLLDNKGYFQAEVTYEVVEEGRTGEVRYDLAIRPPYVINSISVAGDDSPLLTAIRRTMVDYRPEDRTTVRSERVAAGARAHRLGIERSGLLFVRTRVHHVPGRQFRGRTQRWIWCWA